MSDLWQTKSVSVGIPKPLRFEMARPNLLQRLAETLDIPLVALIAPSGYGKSTLLAQYARSTSRPAVWFSIRADQSGAFEMARAFVQAIRTTFLDQAGEALEFAQVTTSEALLRTILEVLGNLDVNADLVIDGIEVLNEDGLGWLDGFIRDLPEGHRVLLSGYSLQNLRLAKRAARGELLVLGTNELAFDAVEIKTYLLARGADALVKDHDMNALQGWPAGLALAASGAQQHFAPEDLVREAVDILPMSLRSELPALAVLEVWSEQRATELGLALSKGWLETLIHHGLPLVMTAPNVYKPHGLLLNWLETELQSQPQRFKPFAMKSAQLALQRQERQWALKMLVWAQDTQAAARIAEELAAEYLARGERRSIRRVLEMVPTEALSPEYKSRLAFNWIETGDVVRGQAWLEQMYTDGEIHAVGLVCLAVLAGRRGEHEEELRLARLARAKFGNQLGSIEIWPLVSALRASGKLEEAQQEVHAFLSYAERNGDNQARVSALDLLVSLYASQRRFGDERQNLALAIEQCEEQGWFSRAVTLRIEFGKLLAIAGDFSNAQKSFDTCRKQIVEDTYAFAQLQEVQGLMQLWQGHLGQAQSYFLEALQVAQKVKAAMVVERIGIWLRDCAYLNHGQEAVSVDFSPPNQAVVAAFDLLRQGDLRTALTAFQNLDTSSLVSVLAIRVTAVLAHLLELYGLDSSNPQTVLQIWGDTVGPHVYCAETLAWTRATTRTEVLVFETTPDRSVTDESRFALTITTFGDFHAQLNGQSVRLALTKSIELLVWLVLHQSGTREDIVSSLWGPDAEERHHEYFRVCVRRLRLAIGEVFSAGNPILIERGLYRLHPDIHPHLDLSVSRSKDIMDPSTTFQMLCKRFLPLSDSDWVNGIRAECAEKAVELGLQLARTVKAADQALDWYNQVLEIDPLCDTAHQERIEQQWRGGMLTVAQKSLNRYQDVVRRELGLGVDPVFLRKASSWGLKP
jgi:LuxR family transcriptional regulator, maltose regulon positive regulatory protein